MLNVVSTKKKLLIKFERILQKKFGEICKFQRKEENEKKHLNSLVNQSQ
jgi:hypothetical protein